MGKRSDFKKIEKDAYQTIDKRAVEVLSLFLPPQTVYAEPCAGEGLLIKDLSSYGHICAYQSDIETGKDAMTLSLEDLDSVRTIITNPPWTRKVLHPMIEHFVNIHPEMVVYMLFDADWMHTKQATELLSNYCTDIMSIGRLKWIPDTNMQGKDNCCWYRFKQNAVEPIRFWERPE